MNEFFESVYEINLQVHLSLVERTRLNDRYRIARNQQKVGQRAENAHDGHPADGAQTVLCSTDDAMIPDTCTTFHIESSAANKEPKKASTFNDLIWREIILFEYLMPQYYHIFWAARHRTHKSNAFGWSAFGVRCAWRWKSERKRRRNEASTTIVFMKIEMQSSAFSLNSEKLSDYA